MNAHDLLQLQQAAADVATARVLLRAALDRLNVLLAVDPEVVPEPANGEETDLLEN